MRTFFLVVLLLIAHLAMPVRAATLTIGIDVSTSTPLVMSPEYARVASQYVRARVAALQPGDTVRIRTFGDRGLVHFPSETIRITRSERADKVADMVARFVASLPTRALEGQGSTNIIAFHEFGSHFDCVGGGHILILTDGIESSSYIDGQSLLDGKPLPEPERGFLAGCDVTMLGFGQARDGALPPQAIKNMRTAWTAWMTTAGASFNPIIDP